MTTPYRPDPFEIAGVDLIGERQADGTINIGIDSMAKKNLPAFPEQVEVCGAIYTLEFVKENEWAGREQIEKTNPNDRRLRICWGIYV